MASEMGGYKVQIQLLVSPSGTVRILCQMTIGRDRGYIFYPGQVRSCFRCGSTRHLSSDCTIILHSKCGKQGHRGADCNNMVVCNLCNEDSHSYSNCPHSTTNTYSPELLKGLTTEETMARDTVDIAEQQITHLAAEKEKKKTDNTVLQPEEGNPNTNLIDLALSESPVLIEVAPTAVKGAEVPNEEIQQKSKISVSPKPPILGTKEAMSEDNTPQGGCLTLWANAVPEETQSVPSMATEGGPSMPRIINDTPQQEIDSFQTIEKKRRRKGKTKSREMSDTPIPEKQQEKFSPRILRHRVTMPRMPPRSATRRMNPPGSKGKGGIKKASCVKRVTVSN
nr:PREDICTED: uncharacterized protein LOC106701990 isoform X1 [Latimeria chalumnae]|eukprot:XP_014339565.1 PREDICTED: uncharacterized protein LOC106701990 isoform X1 [Latimeria chalumnae]